MAAERGDRHKKRARARKMRNIMVGGGKQSKSPGASRRKRQLAERTIEHPRRYLSLFGGLRGVKLGGYARSSFVFWSVSKPEHVRHHWRARPKG